MSVRRMGMGSTFFRVPQRLELDEKKFFDYFCYVHQKVAFIHIQKCAGTYVDAALRAILIPQGFRYFNPWYMTRAQISSWGRDRGSEESLSKAHYRRDWNHTELGRIIEEKGPLYIHNHSKNWAQIHFKRMQELEYFTFCFLREPLDLMCSMYFFLLEKSGESSDPAWGFPPGKEGPIHPMGMADGLNDFIERYTYNLDTLLPPFISEISFVKLFNQNNLQILLSRHFDVHDAIMLPKINTSSNRGSSHYVNENFISDKAQEKIKKTLFFRLCEFLKEKDASQVDNCLSHY